MTDTVYLKAGDLAPTLELTLTDGRTGTAVDLSTAESVTLVMTDRTGTVVVDHGPMTVVDAATGQIERDWESGETDTPGICRAEVEVTWPGDRIQTFPAKGHITISIDADLG
ncbi:MAG: hypothetical protein AB7I38_14375 [Dehalococcoidia bacterium]